MKIFLSLVLSLTAWHSVQAESLYREDSYRALVSDDKAHRVGDVLTVQIFENSSASTTTDTDTRRNNAINAEMNHGSSRKVSQLGISTGGDFDGGGKTQRSNRLLTTVSVTVQEILPNGDLKVAGEQQLTVNNELQKVTLQGRVRPSDISQGNVVLSTRLADAKITYDGEGDLADRNRRPWWRKWLDIVGL